MMARDKSEAVVSLGQRLEGKGRNGGGGVRDHETRGDGG